MLFKIVSRGINSLHQKTVDSHTILHMNDKRVTDCSETHPWTGFTPHPCGCFYRLPPPTHIQFFGLFPGAHRPCNPLIDSPHAPPPLV